MRAAHRGADAALGQPLAAGGVDRDHRGAGGNRQPHAAEHLGNCGGHAERCAGQPVHRAHPAAAGAHGQVLGGDLSRWLPFAAGSALGRLPAAIAGGLTQVTGAVVLVAYAVAFSAVALAVSLRRDVA